MLLPVDKAQTDKIYGCLLGLAVGDALGATNEFKTKESIVVAVRDMVGGGWLNLKAGETTDDTEMMLCILEAYASRGYALEQVSDNFLAWLNSKPKDIGNLTRNALQELKRGVSPRESGRLAWETMRQSGAGNGAVMRCAPTAVLRALDQEARVIETIEIARVTHFDQSAVEAATWLNAMIAAFLTGQDPHQAARAEVLLAREQQQWETPEADVLTWVKKAEQLEIDELNTSGYALATVQMAVWVLDHCQDFEEGMILAVNQGGDADTIGAVTGALLGAKYGRSGIPKRWLSALKVKSQLEQTLQKALAHVSS